MKPLYFFLLFNSFTLLSFLNFSKTIIKDTTSASPTQYRRGVGLPKGYQTYGQKYASKNLNEEKRNLFPINYKIQKLNKVTNNTGTWIEINPKVPRVDYVGVDFINKDTGWACGDLGTIIKTIDGGESWKVIPTNTTKPILKIRSYNGKTVIASGYDGLILRSTDEGETFEQVESGVDSVFDLWGLKLVNDTLGWACGATALLKTTNGGENWQRVNTPGYAGNLWWIDFLNEKYGFVAADGKVLRTTDGGENWEIIQAGDSQPLYSVDVIDSLHIAAAGYGGTSYRGKNMYSSDGGYTWVNGGPLTFEAVNCIKYINHDTGYVILNEVGIWKTTNRGENWTTIGNIGEWELQLLQKENIGYNVGSRLSINKAEGNFDVWKRLIINDNFSDVFFINEQKGFAISSYEFAAPYITSYGLYETMDGGISWAKVPGAPDGFDLLFIDSLTGFIGGDKIYKTIDGGISWYVPNGGNGGASKIFFINNGMGWAIHSNVIYKTTDEGDNWFEQFSAPLSVGFYSIYFVDSLYGWTANADRPFKTTDGGTNWIQQTNLDLWNSDDIYFANQYTGWMAIYSSINPSLFKTTDGGITWLPQPEVVGARKFNFFPDSIHWIINGFDRRYITNNGGNSWTEITSDVPDLNNFNALTNNIGYAVGNLGMIYKFIDTTYVPVELISFEGIIKDKKVILSWQTATELNNSGFQIEKSFNKRTWYNIDFINGKGTTTELSHYFFIDKVLPSGVQYYRLKQIDYNGSFEYSKIIEVNANENISSFNLLQNYPNPFNPETNIEYTIPEETFVNISLFDVTGRKIRELVNEKKQPGKYSLKLKGGELSAGVYFYRLLTTSDYIAVKKLIILK